MNYEYAIAELYADFRQVFAYIDGLTVGTNIGLEPYDFEQFGELVTGADVDIVDTEQHSGISDEVLYMVTLWTTDTEWGLTVEDTAVRVVRGDVSVDDAIRAVESLDIIETVWCDGIDRETLLTAAETSPRTVYLLAVLTPFFTTEGS